MFASMLQGRQLSTITQITTCLEQLPDELLLMICSYLHPLDILQAFNDINLRLNLTISQYRQNIDLRSLSLHQFNAYCDLIRSSLGNEVRSLIISNAAPAVRQLVHFRTQIDSFATLLSSLEKLTLVDHYDDELDLYLPLLILLDNLKELTINFVILKNASTLATFISQMLTNNFYYFDHVAKRRKREGVYLTKLTLVGTGYLKLTPIYNETITHLTIEVEDTDDLLQIFTGFDSLKYLSLEMKKLTALALNE